MYRDLAYRYNHIYSVSFIEELFTNEKKKKTFQMSISYQWGKD